MNPFQSVALQVGDGVDQQLGFIGKGIQRLPRSETLRSFSEEGRKIVAET